MARRSLKKFMLAHHDRLAKLTPARTHQSPCKRTHNISQVIPPLLAAAAPAFCWDGFGHQTVGLIAQQYVTRDANATNGDLIGLNPAFDISDAAAWADTAGNWDNLP